MWSTVDGSEKRGRGVWKNHLYEADGFKVEHMMGEIESVQMSEGYGANREVKGNGCIGVGGVGYGYECKDGYNRAKESSGE